MSAPGPRYLTSPATTAAKLPFSEAVRVGDLLFVSGQLGNRPGTLELVPGGIAAEARQTMENVKATLERHGASLANVVKCTVFLADMAEWRDFNKVYLEYFAPDRLPARSALGASGLALGGRIELEVGAWSPAPAGETAGGGGTARGASTPRQPFA